MTGQDPQADLERLVEEANVAYERNTALRTAVVAIPGIGGSLDMVLASEGQRIFRERTLRFFGAMRERMETLDDEKIDKEYLRSEEFLDLVLKALDSAIKTRDEQKIRLYARILTESTVARKRGKYFPEEYLDVLARLTPMQVEVARVMHEVQGDPREGHDPEGRQVWREQSEEVRRRLGLEYSQLVFMLKGLVAAGLVLEIGRTTVGMIRVEYSISPSFKEMMRFLELSK